MPRKRTVPNLDVIRAKVETEQSWMAKAVLEKRISPENARQAFKGFDLIVKAINAERRDRSGYQR
jgi:hypothetical protein